MTRPFAVVGLHRSEEQFQLLNRYAVAGQYAQHLDEQICNREREIVNKCVKDKVSERGGNVGV